MLAQLNTLKDQLKLDEKLSKLIDKKKEGGGKKKNKKNRSNKVNHKKDEAWKKVPPKDGEKKRQRMWENTLTTGASTICPGPSTRQLSAASASSTGKSRSSPSR